MSSALALEQLLNAFQFGLMLFLLAAGLTLVFGIMDLINLAHGSLYMLGAYMMVTFMGLTGNFFAGVVLALAATAICGMLIELVVLRRLYQRDHLAQVLATFGLILCINETVRWIWGPQQIALSAPAVLSGSVSLGNGFVYSKYRLGIIVVGLLVAFGLFWLVNRTRLGMWIRAGASNRTMATALGVDIRRLYTLVFGLSAALCALAGAVLGPLLSVSVGMGESIIILAFVVIVIGGIGSIRGALVGSLLVALADTFGRAYLPSLLRPLFGRAEVAESLAAAAGSILIYVLMAAVLAWRPAGLFPARG
ncbi:MAG TPA: branched-chain amino acid ABC transporter permease [Ramlibacter sp.]|nr:branched-chain amino acid ABC transporter permease [Ramlibacter sp.]